MNKETFNTLWAAFDQSEWPSFLDFSMTENVDDKTSSVKISCHISPELSWFTGHFPEQPVLPGVVQTHWAGELSATLFPVGDFQQVNGLKFKSMIFPDTSVTLNLLYKAEKNSVAFRYESAPLENQGDTPNEVFTTGSLLFI